MLDKISKGTYGLKVQGFLMFINMVNIVLLIIIMQNTLHVGKGLCNFLLLTIKAIFWGKYKARKNHLLLVDKFNKNQHELLEEDVNVKDKQNFLIVQCTVFSKIRECFEAIDEGIIYEGKKFQEHVKGTIILFEVIWAFLKVFHIKK
jgi:hypothetical protein